MQRKPKAIKRVVPVSSLSSIVQIMLIAVLSYLDNSTNILKPHKYWWEELGPGDREGGAKK